MENTEVEQNIDDTVHLLKALAHRGRLCVFFALYKGEKNVGELMAVSGLGQSALSQHLALLRDWGLVTTRREAQTIYYSLSYEPAKKLLNSLFSIYEDPGEKKHGQGQN